jgi:hypothetical protein
MVKGSLKTDMPAILVRVLAESACVARDGGQRGAGKQAGRQAGRQVRVLDERACARLWDGIKVEQAGGQNHCAIYT